MPRILDIKECPACGAELPRPAPRVCTVCGKSLQQRYLSCGCLTSAPPVLLVAFALWRAIAAAL